MSTRAFKSFNKDQVDTIKLKHKNQIIHSDLNTIERYGGGGARCTILEIY